jgi:hypothetical protein
MALERRASPELSGPIRLRTNPRHIEVTTSVAGVLFPLPAPFPRVWSDHPEHLPVLDGKVPSDRAGVAVRRKARGDYACAHAECLTPNVQSSCAHDASTHGSGVTSFSACVTRVDEHSRAVRNESSSHPFLAAYVHARQVSARISRRSPVRCRDSGSHRFQLLEEFHT